MCTKWGRLLSFLLIIILCVTLFPSDSGVINADTEITNGGIIDNSQINEDVKEDVEYNISLDPRGGKVSPTSITVTQGGIYPQLPDINGTKKNYVFKGWYTGITTGVKVNTGDSVKDPAPTKLYARWEGKTITVTLDPRRASLSKKTITVKYAGTYSNLPTPKRNGLVFMGWYTKLTHGSLVKKTTKVGASNNFKLYAKWAPKWYFQTDKRWSKRWYRVRWERSTIGSEGCGPSAMAMVVASLKNPKVTPVHACAWSKSKGYKAYLSGTYDGFFKAYGRKYGIKVTPYYRYGDLRRASKYKASKYHKSARNHVKNGNWVIALVGKSRWTKGGHFILWYKTEGDYALIRDSYSAKAANAKAPVSTLQKAVKRYWIISVPASKRVN